jgi:hypothetical protein
MLTYSRLCELLEYRPDTGEFVWRTTTSNRAIAGEVAGHVTNCGYVRIALDGKRYLRSHLVWLLHTRALPTRRIDHKNRDRTDDRLSNLRLVSATQNLCNASKRSDNTSGVTGVGWSKQKQRWHARLKVDGRVVYSKFFSSLADAERAISSARVEIHGDYACNG